jgi:hypothetical protein
VYKPLLAEGCGGYQSWLGRGNSTTKRIGNLPAITKPMPGRQAQRLIHAGVGTNLSKDITYETNSNDIIDFKLYPWF